MDKQIITFSANEQNLVRIGGEYHYSSNKVSYIGAHFDLGANWDSFDSVRAIWFTDFVNGIATVLDPDGACIVPSEVLKRKCKVNVNLVGSIVENDVLTDRLTSYPMTALVVDANAKVEGTETAEVTPSQFEQFVSIVQDAVANIKDIVSTTLNADYTLTFVYSDGTSYTTPSIRGERGPQGADGADGADGNGIASAVLNSNYTLTLTFTDGTSYTTPSIRGAQGPKGDTGDVSQAQLDAAVSDLKSELNSDANTNNSIQSLSFPKVKLIVPWESGSYTDGGYAKADANSMRITQDFYITRPYPIAVQLLNNSYSIKFYTYSYAGSSVKSMKRVYGSIVVPANTTFKFAVEGKSPISDITEVVTLYGIVNSVQYVGDNISDNVESGLIVTAKSVGEVVDLTAEASDYYVHAVTACTTGDRFIVNGVGGGNPRLWCFVDADNKVLSVASAYTSGTNLIITAPTYAKKLILNYDVSSIYSTYKEADGMSLASMYIEQATQKNTVPQTLQSTPDKELGEYIRGIKFANELNARLMDFKKSGDLMVHVSTFTIIDDVVYCTYYANTRSSSEDPTKHTARLAYAPLDNPSDMVWIDLQDIGDTYDGKTVDAIYDTILLRKDESTLYLMWTASLNGVYYRLYRTFDVATKTLGTVSSNNFYVGSSGGIWNTTNMVNAFTAEGISHNTISGDIGIMQKLTSRIESGVTYYYTGAYVGAFNCIIKSSDLINWYFVAMPPYETTQWENSVYVYGDEVFYFVRQEAKYNTGILTKYNLNTKKWDEPVYVSDCQSRSDFFVFGGNLYLIHAPSDRIHIGITKIDKVYPALSYELQTARMPASAFYPFVIVYNNELYISYTESRTHLWLCKFTINEWGTESDEAVISKMWNLFNS